MEYVNMENRKLLIEEQVYNFVAYLFDNGVVSNEDSLSTIRTTLHNSIKQVFGKKVMRPIDLVTTINKVLAQKGVIQWG